jgi:phosphosulfolactate phosphohydrolase-like enzyme
MRALERANKVRLARADLKRRVAVDDVAVAEVIMDCPWEAQSMAVGDLLMSQRRWGQTRCRKFLAQVPMSEQKTIGSMTDRQRRTLAAMLMASQRGRSWNAAEGGLPFVTDSLMRA